jgi:hypothetical protein
MRHVAIKLTQSPRTTAHRSSVVNIQTGAAHCGSRRSSSWHTSCRLLSAKFSTGFEGDLSYIAVDCHRISVLVYELIVDVKWSAALSITFYTALKRHARDPNRIRTRWQQ